MSFIPPEMPVSHNIIPQGNASRVMEPTNDPATGIAWRVAQQYSISPLTKPGGGVKLF